MLAKRLKTANRHGRELEGQVAFLPVYVRAHNSFAAPARVSFASKMALFRALADHTNSRNATLSAQRDRDRTGAEDMRSALILKFVNEKYGPNYTSVLADVERFRKRRMRKWFEVLKEVDARLMAVSEDNPGTAPAMYVLDPAVEIAAAENAPAERAPAESAMHTAERSARAAFAASGEGGSSTGLAANAPAGGILAFAGIVICDENKSAPRPSPPSPYVAARGVS